MKAVIQKLISVSLAVMLLCSVAVANADELSFYESLPDVTIGKVFFSPVQRTQLDQRRGSVPAPGVAASSQPGASKKKANSNAAGFIVSSKGGSKVYSNGDFIAAKPGDSVRFPGTVHVVRNDNPHESETADAGD